MNSYLIFHPYCMSHDKDIHSIIKFIQNKGSLFSTQKVSVFPEIGVFLGQKSAKRGVLFICREH